MSRLPVLDENAGWELKIRTIARAPNEGDPAAALAGRPRTAVSRNRAFRPRPRHRFLHQGPRGPLCRRQRNARPSLRIRRRRRADRPQGERGVREPRLANVSKRRISRSWPRGSRYAGRMELHLYPDGGEGWCLTWKEPLIDAGRRHSRPRGHLARRAGFVGVGGPGFGRPVIRARLYRRSSRRAIAHS